MDRILVSLRSGGNLGPLKHHHGWLVSAWNHFYAGAPFWTAIGTIALATVTYKLVVQTTDQDKHNHVANERSYALTLRQINLQHRAPFYEEALVYLEDSLYALVTKAEEINFPFIDVTESTPSDRKSALSHYAERVLPNRLFLHATEEVNALVLNWVLRFRAELGKLNDLVEEKTSNQTVDFHDDLHQAARSEFQAGLEWLTHELSSILVLMKSEFHPTSEVLPKSKKKWAFFFHAKEAKQGEGPKI